jgi:hypothetical protein
MRRAASLGRKTTRRTLPREHRVTRGDSKLVEYPARLSSGYGTGYFFFFFLLRRSSRRSRRFAPATLTAEAGLPTRASASDTARTVAGIARLDAMANPKRPNTPRRETNSDFIFSVIMVSRLSRLWLIDTPIEGNARPLRPIPFCSKLPEHSRKRHCTYVYSPGPQAPVQATSAARRKQRDSGHGRASQTCQQRAALQRKGPKATGCGHAPRQTGAAGQAS